MSEGLPGADIQSILCTCVFHSRSTPIETPQPCGTIRLTPDQTCWLHATLVLGVCDDGSTGLNHRTTTSATFAREENTPCERPPQPSSRPSPPPGDPGPAFRPQPPPLRSGGGRSLSNCSKGNSSQFYVRGAKLVKTSCRPCRK